QGHGPAGRSFWVHALSEVDRRTTKHLVLLFEQAVALLQVPDLGFFGQGETLTLTVFDLGSLDPAGQARLRDAEVLGDPAHRSLSSTSDRDDVAAELLGERFGHVDLPSGEA